MELTMGERRAVSRQVAKRYQKAGKKEKGHILDEFLEITGYTRCYGAYVLRIWGKKVEVNTVNGKKLVFIGSRKRKARRRKDKKYDAKVLAALSHVWQICDCICGKRLGPYLKTIVPVLEDHGELSLDDETRRKLMTISAATVDRMLAQERKSLKIKGRCRTKPGTLLKNQIPIRTYADWDEKEPGFLEIDLVSHDGGNTRGDFMQTLDATDVMTQWTETRAVKNKAQIWTLKALKDVKEKLPFKMKGIDSDNGSEFINAHMVKFCRDSRITFTRSRPYRKNDNCFVEQKNYSVVRRTVGYSRYDTAEELEILNNLYGYLRLYTNYFQPVMKLVKKQRIGSKVKKKYDEAKTPYARVLKCASIPAGKKARLKKEYKTLNPAQLKRNITVLQNKLIDLAIQKGRNPDLFTISLPRSGSTYKVVG